MGKVVCVDSSCVKHTKGANSAIPEEPILSTKPETALCDLQQPLATPSDFDPVHHKVELVALIGAMLYQATEKHVRKATAGYSVTLDLTLYDVQGKMKEAEQPQEETKAFDSSCPLSEFIPVAEFTGDP